MLSIKVRVSGNKGIKMSWSGGIRGSYSTILNLFRDAEAVAGAHMQEQSHGYACVGTQRPLISHADFLQYPRKFDYSCAPRECLAGPAPHFPLRFVWGRREILGGLRAFSCIELFFFLPRLMQSV